MIRFRLGPALILVALAGSGSAGAATSETAELLCAADAARRAAAVLQEASPLWGASEIYVARGGEVVVVDVRHNAEESAYERRYRLEDAEVAAELFDLLCDADVLGAEFPQGVVPPTCTSTPTLILQGASGAVRQVPFTRDGPDGGGRFEKAWLVFSALKRRALRETPEYEGSYDPGYVPESFSWAGEILSGLKDVTFTPVADPEAMSRAEGEYQERAELQREAIERVRAAQEGGTP